MHAYISLYFKSHAIAQMENGAVGISSVSAQSSGVI